MGRRRVYATAAERQQAHRRRHSQPLIEAVAPPSAPPRRLRPPSRPARLVALVDEAQDLLDEYRDWLERLPEAFEGTATYDLLTEAVERLEIAVENLEGIDPPRGFGRD